MEKAIQMAHRWIWIRLVEFILFYVAVLDWH